MHMYAGFKKSALVKRASLQIRNSAFDDDMLADRWHGDNKEHFYYLDSASANDSPVAIGECCCILAKKYFLPFAKLAKINHL